jgi:hypothetical protein
MVNFLQNMADFTHDESPMAAAGTETKQAWHAPTLEEVDYAETEVGGGPGALYDGLGTYSIP